MIKTTAKTKLFGLIGSPVSHSLSPKMHSHLAESLGIDAAYLAFDIKKEDLKSFLLGLKSVDVLGFNVTVPYKIDVIEYLDEVENDAKNMNSVNTVVNKNGKWYGYNTDGEGFCRYLLMEGCEIKDKNILVIGAGGAALGVCYKLAVNDARSITVTSRTKEKVNNILKMVKKYSNADVYDEVDVTKEYDIIINATPLGMHPNEDKNPCTFMELIGDKTICSDLVYNPAKTLFLEEAEKKGAKIINGLGMLIMQGILAFELFNDVEIDHEKYYNELSEVFKKFKI